jgi:hypothetical protein
MQPEKSCISTTWTKYIPDTNKLVCASLPQVPRLQTKLRLFIIHVCIHAYVHGTYMERSLSEVL